MLPSISLQKSIDNLFRPNGKVFYGWWIVAIAALIQFVGGVLWMQSYGLYTVVLHEEFSWSMTILSGAFALTRVESGLLGPLQGWLVDRYGPRIILTVGLAMFGIGFLLLAQTDSLLSYYLSVFVISVGVSLGGFHTLMVSIVNWFQRHRTKAVAWSQMGYSLGGLCVPVVAWGMELYDWRTVALISAGMIFLLGIPAVQWILHRPEQKGEQVDGMVYQEAEENKAVGGATSFTWRDAVRTPAFWLISAGHGIALLSVSSVIVHMVPHLTKGAGLGLTEASLIFSLVSVFQLVGLGIGGFLGDLFNKRLIAMTCMLFHGSGMLILAYSEAFPMLVMACVLHGLAWGTRGPLMVAIRADYFGPRSFGTIMGISSLIVMLGMMAGPMICGLIVDSFGSYEMAFELVALFSIVGALCFFFAKKPQNLITA
jgi:MFS family permease